MTDNRVTRDKIIRLIEDASQRGRKIDSDIISVLWSAYYAIPEDKVNKQIKVWCSVCHTTIPNNYEICQRASCPDGREMPFMMNC